MMLLSYATVPVKSFIPPSPHPRARPSSSHQLLTRTQLPQFVPFRGDLLTSVQCIRTHRLSLPHVLTANPRPFLSVSFPDLLHGGTQSVNSSAYLYAISLLTTYRSTTEESS